MHEGTFIMPNPWDLGSARILVSLGFPALATTSSGHAGTLGLKDGEVGRDEAIEHGAAIAGATSAPVSADLENGFGDTPEAVAETVRLASATALAGCSIEDYSGTALYEREHAADRIRAAVEAARTAESSIVLTARAENHIRGNPDLDDTITRLQLYQEAGADVLYAPGLMDLDDIRRVRAAVDRPINVLVRPGGPTASQIFEAGGNRISVGGALFHSAYAALIEAGNELLGPGTHDFWNRAAKSVGSIRKVMAGGS